VQGVTSIEEVIRVTGEGIEDNIINSNPAKTNEQQTSEY